MADFQLRESLFRINKKLQRKLLHVVGKNVCSVYSFSFFPSRSLIHSLTLTLHLNVISLENSFSFSRCFLSWISDKNLTNLWKLMHKIHQLTFEVSQIKIITTGSRPGIENFLLLDSQSSDLVFISFFSESFKILSVFPEFPAHTTIENKITHQEWKWTSNRYEFLLILQFFKIFLIGNENRYNK